LELPVAELAKPSWAASSLKPRLMPGAGPCAMKTQPPTPALLRQPPSSPQRLRVKDEAASPIGPFSYPTDWAIALRGKGSCLICIQFADSSTLSRPQPAELERRFDDPQAGIQHCPDHESGGSGGAEPHIEDLDQLAVFRRWDGGDSPQRVLRKAQEFLEDRKSTRLNSSH